MKTRKLQLNELRIKSFIISPDKMESLKGQGRQSGDTDRDGPISITSETSVTNAVACTNPHVCKKTMIIACAS